MKTNKQLIDDTLNSLELLQRAKPDPDLVDHILNSAGRSESTVPMMKRPFTWAIAAGIVLLISLNVAGLLYVNKTQNHATDLPSAISTEYLSYLEPIKL